MKKLLCLMILASFVAASAEAAPTKPVTPKSPMAKAAKPLAKNKEALSKTTKTSPVESYNSAYTVPQNSIRTPLGGWTQDSKVK